MAALVSTVMMRMDKRTYLSAHAKTQGMVHVLSDTTAELHRDMDSVKMWTRPRQ